MTQKLKNNLMTTKSNKKINSLYVHIPFCTKICPYCDFIKVIDEKSFKSRYLKELIKDIKTLEQKRYFFNTIYIGGGTPSVLEEEQLKELLSALNCVKKYDTEFTFEANPESITVNKLKIPKKYGINRISIGVQSFNNNILKEINRDYNVDIFKLIEIVKKYIPNINVDFIYGLPNQTFEDLKNDLNNFVSLNVNHISIYSLILEKGTMFYKNNVKEISDESSRQFYDYIVSFLREHDYKRYEVSNFCRIGYKSKHNLTYWHDEEYVGLGIGASGFENNIRYKNSSSLTKYLNGIREREEEVVSIEDDYEYYLICNLRLEDGFSLKEFEKRFGFNLLTSKEKEIKELIELDLVVIKNDYFKCSDEGIALLDRVILKLL